MTDEINFIDRVLKAFGKIIGEIEKGSSEYDIRYKFEKYFLEEVLKYEPKYIKWEKKRADLTIIDENNFAVIKIETKRPTEDIDKIQHERQAFKYEEEITRYIGLTNFLRFKVWEIKKTGSELRVNLDFSKILEYKKPIERLSSEEKTQILFLNNLSKELLFAESKYEKFDETYARIDITKEAGFRKLLDRLTFIANDLLFGYTLKAFGEYKEGYNKYRIELDNIERESKNNKNDKELNHNIIKYRQKLEEKYKKYTSFSGFWLWKEYSGKEDVSDEEVKEIFCKESIYVLLNKLLFIRICEDKGLLPKNISNGGIEILRQRTIHEEKVYKEILDWSFNIASGLYSHFYETGILDWFRTGDGELNRILNKVLWTLNQFNFAHVDRDILGNLYEKYLPGKERKKLGEFYTPVEIIDYILTSVEYTYSYDIENKDLLDPACGSGGFLVRAARRMISRYLMKFGKANKIELRNPKNWKEMVGRLTPDEAKIILDSIKEHIYGLDINPFACHIAEMNMLFQTIDLYQKVKEKYKDYELGRFKIYRTDSLEFQTQKQIYDYTHPEFLEEQDEIGKIKNKKFDFVVGNPPYVRVQLLDEKNREYLTQNYKTAYRNFDLYVVFIERGLKWLNTDGCFGYITSNQFMNREYGRKIREYILENCRIINIIDFGDSGVFKDVTNYPTIIVLEKTKSNRSTFRFIRVKAPKEDLIKSIFFSFGMKIQYGSYFDLYELYQNNLGGDPWQLTPIFESEILKKIEKGGTLLGKISKILLGVQTGRDSLLIGKITRHVNNKLVAFSSKKGKGVVDKELLKPVLRGKEVRKWRILWSGNYILCPHKNKENTFLPIQEKELKEEYAHAYEFLMDNKHDIESRKWYSKTPEQLHGVWYSLMYYGQVKDFDSLKILTPALTNKNNFVLDSDGYFFVLGTAGVYGITPNKNIDITYLLGILNSSISEYYLKQIAPIKQGGYFQYSTKYLEKLPIKIPETPEEKQTANQIIEKVNEILELNKKSEKIDIKEILKGQETQKLYNIPSVFFSIKDNAKFKSVDIKEDKIFIDSKDYIQMKDKEILEFVYVCLNSITEILENAKEIKKLIYNIEIPKSSDILKEIINKGRINQKEVNERIKKLEQEINELVYELYGITENEKKIIESK